MSVTIRKIAEKDRAAVLEMMRVFYASPCVWSNGSEEIFQADIDACISCSPFAEGYVFEENGALLGYAMTANSFSTEFGKPCVWIEDLYIQSQFRGLGIGSQFLQYITRKNPDAILRLEVETENLRAIHVYRNAGFDFLPYTEMKK